MKYRRWPSYWAWRALRRSSPKVRDLALPYFEQPAIKLDWGGLYAEANRMRGQIMEDALRAAVGKLRPRLVSELNAEVIIWERGRRP